MHDYCARQLSSESSVSSTNTLDGESFTKKFAAQSPNGDKLLEFVRESETFERWTKLIGYRYQTHGALIDFLVLSPDQKFMEFNLFKTEITKNQFPAVA